MPEEEPVPTPKKPKKPTGNTYPKISNLSEEEYNNLVLYVGSIQGKTDNETLERLLNDPDFDIPDWVIKPRLGQPERTTKRKGMGFFPDEVFGRDIGITLF